MARENLPGNDATRDTGPYTQLSLNVIKFR